MLRDEIKNKLTRELLNVGMNKYAIEPFLNLEEIITGRDFAKILCKILIFNGIGFKCIPDHNLRKIVIIEE